MAKATKKAGPIPPMTGKVHRGTGKTEPAKQPARSKRKGK